MDPPHSYLLYLSIVLNWILQSLAVLQDFVASPWRSYLSLASPKAAVPDRHSRLALASHIFQNAIK